MLSDPLEEPPPSSEELVAVSRGPVEADQVPKARLDPASLLRVGDVLLEAARELGARGLGVVGVGDPRASSHHLGERPEGDTFAIRRAATLVPEERLRQAVDVLLQLPHQTRLADAGDTRDVQQPRTSLAPGGVQQLLGQPELFVPTAERWLGCGSAV